MYKQIVAREKEHGSDYSGALHAMLLGQKPASFRDSLSLELADDLENCGLRHIGPYVYDPKQVADVITKYSGFADHGLETPEQTIEFLANSKPNEHSELRGLVLGFPLSAVRSFEDSNSLIINDVAKNLYKLLSNRPGEQLHLELNYFSEAITGNDDLVPWFERKLSEYKTELGLDQNQTMQVMDELRYKIAGKRYNINGVYWADLSRSEESEERARQLETSFANSPGLETLIANAMSSD